MKHLVFSGLLLLACAASLAAENPAADQTGSCTPLEVGQIIPPECRQFFSETLPRLKLTLRINAGGDDPLPALEQPVDDQIVTDALSAAIATGSQDALLAWVAANHDRLTDDQFLQLIEKLYTQLSRGYDNNRASLSAGGNPGGTAILRAVRHNTTMAADGTPDYAGVCRDHASLIGRMLEARGFRNTYIVLFPTEGDYHATVITRHPTQNTIYRCDYVGCTKKDGLGEAKDLFQGDDEVALNYRVYRPDGHQVADVVSEFGKMAAETTGFDASKLDPLARQSGSLATAELRLDDEGAHTARVFAGRDGMGAYYSGLSYHVDYGKNTIAPGAFGVSLGYQYRPQNVYRTAEDHHAAYLYLQEEQHLHPPEIQATDELKLGADLNATLIAEGQITKSSAPAQFIGQGDLRVGTELKAQYASKDGTYKADYRLGASTSPGLADVRDIKSVAMTFNSAYFGMTQTLNVDSVALIAETLLVVDQLGARSHFTVGAGSDKIAASLSYSGRLTNNTALLQDGSIRTLGLHLQLNPDAATRLGLGGEIPLEGGDRAKDYARISGDFGASF